MTCKINNKKIKKIDYFEEYSNLSDFERKTLHEKVDGFEKLSSCYFGGVKVYYTYPAENLRTFSYLILVNNNKEREKYGNRLVRLIENNLNYEKGIMVSATYTEIDRFEILMEKVYERERTGKWHYLFIKHTNEFLDLFVNEIKPFLIYR